MPLKMWFKAQARNHHGSNRNMVMSGKPIRVLTQSRSLSAAAACIFLYLVALTFVNWGHPVPARPDVIFAISRSVALLMMVSFAISCDQRLERILYWLIASDFAADLLVVYVFKTPAAFSIKKFLAIIVWLSCAGIALSIVLLSGKKN